MCSILTIQKIYCEPAFEFFVSFLKKEVMTWERFPDFIMAFPVKPAEKIAMIR